MRGRAQVRQLALQAAAGHGQPVPADLSCHVAVAQVRAGPEELGHPARETGGPRVAVTAHRFVGLFDLYADGKRCALRSR
jgi:hypothetical protein